jgi:uncharacterized membrane protein
MRLFSRKISYFPEYEMHFFVKSSVSNLLCILFFIVLYSSEGMVLTAYSKYTTDIGKIRNLHGQKIYVNSTVVGVIISNLFSSLCFLVLLTEGASEV